MSKDAIDYRLTLRPNASAVPSEKRLARLLKLAWRAFGFRCVKCEELPREEKKGPADDDEGRQR